LAARRASAGTGKPGPCAAIAEQPDAGHELARTGAVARAGTGFSDTGGASSSAETGVSAAESFLFERVTAALYHRSRVTWFAGLHRVGMFLNILAGTAAVAFIKDNHIGSIALALLVAVISATNLAFDFAGLARKHEDARKSTHDLAAELEEGDGSDETVKRLRARLIRSAGSEPMVFEVAEKAAYNAAIISLGRDRAEEWVLAPHQRALRHLWPYSGTKFLQRKDVKLKGHLTCST
jgi:hypothetical protein